MKVGDRVRVYWRLGRSWNAADHPRGRQARIVSATPKHIAGVTGSPDCVVVRYDDGTTEGTTWSMCQTAPDLPSLPPPSHLFDHLLEYLWVAFWLAVFFIVLFAIPAHAQPAVSLDDFTSGPELAPLTIDVSGFDFSIAEAGSPTLPTQESEGTSAAHDAEVPLGDPAEPRDWSWPFLLIGFGLDYTSTYVGIEEYGLRETAPGREGADVWTIAAFDVLVLGALWGLDKAFPESRVLRIFRWILGGGKIWGGWHNFQLIGEIHDRRGRQ